MLEVNNIKKSFTNPAGTSLVDVLRGVSHSFPKGKWTSIMGPSGSGKSTLLKIIGLMETPDSGDVLLENTAIHSQKAAEKARTRNRDFGFIFQEHLLLPHLSLIENVQVPILANSHGDNSSMGRAGELLKKLNLDHRESHMPGELSGGENQRGAVARALINNPRVLLCDEPTGNLDSDNTDQLLSLLENLRMENDLTIISVTHSEKVAAASDDVLILENGLLRKN